MADTNPKSKAKLIPISIPSPLVEFILLGPLDDRRQLQDSPILGDVWVEFGRKPQDPLDLLIAPYRGKPAGKVASLIDADLGPEDDKANIAFLQGLVVAHLTFEEVLRVVTPKTKWWLDKWKKGGSTPIKQAVGTQVSSEADASAPLIHDMKKYDAETVKSFLVKKILDPAVEWHKKTGKRQLQEVPAFERFLALTALIHWAGQQKPTRESRPN